VEHKVNGSILYLLLAALPAGGEQPHARVAPVTLYTHFQQNPPAALLVSIQSELEVIMTPAGLHFDWHPLADAGGRISSQLAVIHFKGACDVADLRPDTGYLGPLGWINLTDGEILPFIDVNCDAIRLFIQHDLIAVPAAAREEAFGRAVARVLAHELYHLLANTKAHTSVGVAKAAYSVGDLLSQTFQFDKKECALLRLRAVHLEPQMSGEVSVPAQGQ
jgi:hypothetical protein